MSDTSGTEAPSRFMMGLEEPPLDDASIDQALEAAFGARATAEGDEEPPSSPPPADPPGATPTPDEEQGGDGETPPDTTEGQEQGGETPPPEAIGGDTDFVALFQNRYGRAPSHNELQGLIDLADWANSLSPEQQEAVNRALQNPQQVLAPEPPAPDPLAEEYADDPIYQRLRALEENYERFAEQQVTQQYDRTVQALTAGQEAFKAQYNLSDQDTEVLQGAVAQSRILPGLVQTYGDPRIAMEKAMEHVYWTTPTFRERHIQQTTEQQQQQQQAHEERKRRASSVTGTGGNGASRTEVPKEPKSADERWQAVTTLLRDHMNNGQPDN